MATIIDTGFKSDIEHLRYLQALMTEYNIYTEDISALSLVGFIAHANTDINNAVLHRSNQALKESHVITANRWHSLYKHGREVEVFPKYSKPCRMEFVLLIEENDFLAYATINGDTANYVLSADNFITVGSYIYSFDYNIDIRLENGADNEKYLTARYVIEGTKNPISDLVNPTIKAIRRKTPNGHVYQLYVVLQQYHREYTERTITDRDYAVFPISTKRSVDEIAAIDVFHISKASANIGTIKRLDQKMYFENSRTDRDTIFIHHKSANSFDLIHKSDPGGFRPASGDLLQTVLYVTSGSGAEFNFAYLQGSNIKFRYIDENPLYVKPVLINGISTGGVSYGNNKEALRREIITKKSTRDSIVIENDLSMILNNTKSVSNLNDYAVIKNRNDIIKVFNIYTTLNFVNNGTSFTIPTNTLDVEWDFVADGEEAEAGSKFYLMNTPYVTSNEIKKGVVRKESDLAGLDTKHLKYRVPFILAYDKENNIIRSYEVYTDEKYWTDYYLLNHKVPYSYICNWVRFVKEDFDKPFDIEFEVRINLTETKPSEKLFNIVQSGGKDVLQDSGFLEVHFILENDRKEQVYKAKCQMKGYTVNGDDDFFTYGLRLIEQGPVKIRGDKIEIHNPDTNSKVWVNIEGLTGKIEISSPTERSTGSALLDTNRQIVNRFTFDCDLTKNRTAQFKIQHSVLGNNKIKLFFVPCVELEFYKKHYKIFRNSIYNEYTMEERLAKYQGEFSYSLKFINSYGYSNTYTVGLNKDPLNNVILDLNFLIERKVGSTLNKEELSKAVYSYISSLQFLDYEEFHISNLYDYLFAVFPDDIKMIQFQGMNGLSSEMQLISMNISEIANDTIVEKLNIPTTYDEENDIFNFKINWNFR